MFMVVNADNDDGANSHLTLQHCNGHRQKYNCKREEMKANTRVNSVQLKTMKRLMIGFKQ